MHWPFECRGAKTPTAPPPPLDGTGDGVVSVKRVSCRWFGVGTGILTGKTLEMLKGPRKHARCTVIVEKQSQQDNKEHPSMTKSRPGRSPPLVPSVREPALRRHLLCQQTQCHHRAAGALQ
jgi:hypothetical protein